MPSGMAMALPFYIGNVAAWLGVVVCGMAWRGVVRCGVLLRVWCGVLSQVLMWLAVYRKLRLAGAKCLDGESF